MLKIHFRDPAIIMQGIHFYGLPLESNQGGMNVGGSTFHFPIAFPTATLSVQGIVHSNGSANDKWYPYLQVSSVNQQSASIWCDYGGRTWLVVGY